MGCICVNNNKINLNISKKKFQKYSYIENKIWKKIFLYIPIKNIKNISLTNKKFNKIIKEIIKEEKQDETKEKTILTINNKTNYKIEKKKEENNYIESNKLTLNQTQTLTSKRINPIIITNHINKNENENTNNTYIDLFTYLKITINPIIPNEKNRKNSSVSSSISINNKTPSFSDESNHKSLVNVSKVNSLNHNNYNNNNTGNKLSKFYSKD